MKKRTKGCISWHLDTLSSILGASILGNIFAVKGVIRVSDRVVGASEETIRVGQDFQHHLIL